MTTTAERARDLLHYDPETGVFTWKVSRRCTAAGAVAGSPSGKGYLRIGIDGRDYRAHRLAWLMTFGMWPAEYLDHINRDKADNRIANLRECSHAENHQNRSIHSNNTSGFPGVTWQKDARMWRADIKVNRKHLYLGLFNTPEEAYAAYVIAKAKYHTFNPTVEVQA